MTFETATTPEWGLFGGLLLLIGLHWYQLGESASDIRWMKVLQEMGADKDEALEEVAKSARFRSVQRLMWDIGYMCFVLRMLILPDAIAVDGVLALIPNGTVAMYWLLAWLLVGSIRDISRRFYLIRSATARRETRRRKPQEAS